MPQPYTGKHGELNFEADVIETLQKAGWKEVLKNKTVEQLEENWFDIIFDRNRLALNNIPLSASEKDQIRELVRTQANTPVKANHFINGHEIAITRDSDSEDKVHQSKEVYLDLFDAREIAGGNSRYQIAEQTIFNTDKNFQNRRGDLTLLINGMPVIHLELKASGVDVDEANTQIIKYAQEKVWTGFFGLVQVFFAMTPEDVMYFANAGEHHKFNREFFFRWADRDNRIINNWRELIISPYSILSIPEAHKLVAYYTVADTKKDVLKVCRSYQYGAIKAIVKRVKEQTWGNHDQLGGFCWCTTGGGKTMTSFKSGQLIIDMGLADKVVFVVDRQSLDAQSLGEYNSFERPGEEVVATVSTKDLFAKLKSNKSEDHLIMTSIQKLSNIARENNESKKSDVYKIISKRIVFIVDEAHRSQFGEMHQAVKDLFYDALFFGFTGTPIFSDNIKAGEMTTETVFGKVLSIYSLANGIKDGNVLGFYPQKLNVYNDEDVRKEVTKAELHLKDGEKLAVTDPRYAKYRDFMYNKPMASTFNDDGTLCERGIEDYLPSSQYNTPEHRKCVVDKIVEKFDVLSTGENGTKFCALLATTSISEVIEYYHEFKYHPEGSKLHITCVFDTNTNANAEESLLKNSAIDEIVEDYEKLFGYHVNRKTDPLLKLFKEDVMNRLSHKKPYNNVGNDKSQLLDIVIVVNQLLTGFDSQYLNAIFLDRIDETDNLIQAISRTNRVYDRTEKPWGLVVFCRKPNTMVANLNRAIELYCQGEKQGVQIEEIEKQIEIINFEYDKIEKIFAQNKIENFEKLPKDDVDRRMFRKHYLSLKSTIRAAFMQGFQWGNEHGKKLKFNQKIYRLLTIRYEDLPSTRVVDTRGTKAGYSIENDLSVIELEKIDASFIEKQFGIITLSQLERTQEANARKIEAIREIKDSLGQLPEHLQKWAKKVLYDIENDFLIVQKGKTFKSYISEYRESQIRSSHEKICNRYGIDYDTFAEIYETTTSTKDLDEYQRFSNMVNKVDPKLIENDFKIGTTFKKKATFSAYLADYILNKKAEEEDNG